MLVGILIVAWVAIIGGIMARNLFLGARHAARTINRFPSPWVGWYWIATIVICVLIGVLRR